MPVFNGTGGLIIESVGNSTDGYAGHIYTQQASSDLIFSAGNTAAKHLFIKENGLVGVGTTIPLAPLHVDGIIRTNSVLQLSGNTGSGGEINFSGGNMKLDATNGVHLRVPTGTTFEVQNASATKQLSLDPSTGNMALGNTAASARLKIKSPAAGSSGLALEEAGSTQAVAEILEDGASSAGILRLYDGSYNTSVQLNGNGPSILNAGNVGIGVDIPASLLHLKSNAPKLRMDDSDNNRAGSILWDAEEMSVWASGNASENGAGAIVFKNGTGLGTERMRINHDGKVGIGINLPNEPLHVNGNLRVAGINKLVFTNVNTTAYVHSPTSIETRIANDEPAGFVTLRANGAEVLRATPSGTVGIGTTNPGTHKLAVAGTIKAEEIVLESSGADFVFEADYPLRPLPAVERHIQTHKHLPDIPSAAQMQAEGVSMSQMQTKLLQKVEELTLYAIEQDKRLQIQQAENAALKAKVNRLEQEQSEMAAIEAQMAVLAQRVERAVGRGEAKLLPTDE